MKFLYTLPLLLLSQTLGAFHLSSKIPTLKQLKRYSRELHLSPLSADIELNVKGSIKNQSPYGTFAKQFSLCLLQEFNNNPVRPQARRCQRIFDALDLSSYHMAKKRSLNFNHAQLTLNHKPKPETGTDFSFNAHGIIRCSSDNQQCNNQLYVLSQANNDFTKCVKDKFADRPTNSVCQTLFHLLGNVERDINLLKQMNVACDDISVSVKLHE